MSQFYFDPSRENDPHALPDAEVFYVHEGELWDETNSLFYDQDVEPNASGWYYWARFPGCLPDGDPIGPFDTEEEAIADAQEEAEC